MRVLCAVLVLGLPAFAAATSGPLQKAEALIEELQYAAALPELDAALQRQGNSRDELVRIYWLKGMINALLAKPDQARAPLRTVASLAPEFKPDPNQPTRVMTAWFEAKGWATAGGSLTFTSGGSDSSPAGISRVHLAVENDALKLARTARLHVREDGGAWRVVTAKLPGRLSAVTSGTKVEWWGELLGERDAVLAVAGSPAAPFSAGLAPPPPADAPVAAAPPPAAITPAPAPERPVQIAAPAASTTPLGTPLQIAGYSALALGAAAAGVGLYFGVTANGEKARFEQAPRTADGALMGLNQRDADTLVHRQREHAALANGLFVAGGVLAAAGIGLWVAGLTLAPSGTGVVASGALP